MGLKIWFLGDLGILCLRPEFWKRGFAVSYPTPNKKEKTGGVTSLQEADGQVIHGSLHIDSLIY